jgi:uncharacterized protein YfkK (UPF0435 family)
MNQINPLDTQGQPQSPQEVPGIPTGGELSQDQMRSNLQGMMSKIENKQQDVNSQSFLSEFDLKKQKGESLRQLFDIFQSMGIDPSNAEEVGAFLDKIKKNNPELSQQIEKILSSMLEEGDSSGIPLESTPEVSQEVPQGTLPPTDPNMGNMNMNNAESSQNI